MKDLYVEQGSNFVNVQIGVLEIWFSYKAPIAFRCPGYSLTVRENDWGPTTGKHLNAIDGGDKKSRVSGKVFEEQLKKCLQGLNLM